MKYLTNDHDRKKKIENKIQHRTTQSMSTNIFIETNTNTYYRRPSLFYQMLNILVFSTSGLLLKKVKFDRLLVNQEKRSRGLKYSSILSQDQDILYL